MSQRRPDEGTVDQDRVREEHLASVNVPAHWAYLIAVLVGGFVLMVILIAVLGG
jgi:hypothetical protein